MTQGGEILVLGLGNEVLGDEGLGLKLADDLEHSYTIPGLKYAKATNGGLEILEYIRDFKTLIIIDTISAKTGLPGEICYFTPENYRETLHLSSVHDASFLTVIQTGHTLGFKMPGKIDIIAIEILRDLWLGDKLSDVILEKYDVILLEIINFIKNIEI